MNLLLDPGHGGQDSGAFVNNTKESQLNLRLCLLTAGYVLDGSGQNRVNLTRYTDKDLPPPQRRAAIQSQPFDCFICVHHNAASSPKAEGFESFIRHVPGVGDEELQASFHKAIAPLLAKWGVRDRGAKRYNFRVLAEKKCPGLFVEVGFMTSPGEYARLIDRQYQAEWAMALADFIRSL